MARVEIIFRIVLCAFTMHHGLVLAQDAGAQINAARDLGRMYEDQGRWSDAEKIYADAFGQASDAQRALLRKDLERVMERQRSAWWSPLTDYLGTLWEVLWKGAVVLGIALAVAGLLWAPAKRWGTHWGREKLQVGTIEDGSSGEDGAQWGLVIKEMVETAQEYYQPRDLFRFGSFGSLVVIDSPEAPELVRVAADLASDDAGKILDFFVRTFLKPRYRIGGSILRDGPACVVSLQLTAAGSAIGTWNATYPRNNALYCQKRIAFEVAMCLKEYVGTAGNQ